MLPTIFLAGSISPVLLASAIAIAMGLLLVFWGRKSLRESRIVAQVPEAPVGRIAAGLVHVHGKTTGDGALISPITSLPCYYYKSQVEKWVQEGAQGRWQIFKNETGQQRFYIEDGTGRVLVDPQGAEFDLPQTLQAEIGPRSNHSCFIDSATGLPRPTENQLHATLIADWQQARAAIQGVGIPGAKAVDKVLAAGEKMATWGVSMNVDGVEINPGGIGESYRFRETCLLAGHEYSIVGTCAQNPNGNDKDPQDARLIAKGKNETTFLISSRSGQQLTTRLRLQGVIMIAVGAGMIVGAVALGIMRA